MPDFFGTRGVVPTIAGTTRTGAGDRVDTDVELQADLQRVLCAINRTVFKPGDRGDWRAPARGSADLMIAGHQVSELRRLGLVDIATDSVLVPTESGRQSYRLCAARGHGKHLER